MTKQTRRLLVLTTVICAALAALMFVVTAGKAIGASVSNCNRDCDDGTASMYAAFVFGGLPPFRSFLLRSAAHLVRRQHRRKSPKHVSGRSDKKQRT
jgi:hypothetical protein